MSTSLATPPTISLVTPNYNGAAYLRVAIDSVLQQDYPSLEYVIADGASNDGSRLLIEQYRDRVSAIISEPDNGHADALNKGFALTSGDIMGWINSDDALHPGCLSQVARIFASFPEVEWITGRPSTMNLRGELEYVGPVRPWSRLRFLAGDHLWIQQESTFWRRSLWEKAGGRLDTSYDVANDFELWARFFRHADLYTVDRMLGCFRVRPGQRSVEAAARYKREVNEVLDRELQALPASFKQGFGSLIPGQPRELSSGEREAMDGKLNVLDPPIIRMSALRNGSKALQDKGGTRFHSNLQNPEPISDLSPFKNKHAGERCFILGNGPSLNETDLSLLKGETVFGCNACHLLFDRLDWRPSYYTCVDSQVLPDRAPDIEAMLTANPNMVGFFPSEIQVHGGERSRLRGRDVIAEGPNRYFFNEEPGTAEALPSSMFSLDAAKRVIQPHTVAITMLQLAAYMGFSELVLIGCDMRYKVPEAVQREGPATGNDPRLTSTADNDPNHFDPSYFGKGRKWHVPNTDLMHEHFEVARKALALRGVTVINATVGGDLEVFEREPLETIVQRPVAQATHSAKAETIGADPAVPAGPTEGVQSRFEALSTSVRRNWRFATGVSAATGLIIVAAIGIPEWRLAIVLGGLAAATMAFSGAVAIKTRRIVLSLFESVKDAHRGKADAEIRAMQFEMELQTLEIEIQSLETEVDVLRDELRGVTTSKRDYS
jgi:glycosyltransferase involved in cell wall biosynthesis